MNVFEYNDLMKMIQNQPSTPDITGAYQGIDSMPMMGGLSINNPMDGMNPYEIPKPPSPYAEKDVSGFANYGMQAPPLPDPSQQIGGLMKMAIGSNVAGNQAEGQRAPMGGLMAYLKALAGV